jgi:hypothetical protein
MDGHAVLRDRVAHFGVQMYSFRYNLQHIMNDELTQW